MARTRTLIIDRITSSDNLHACVVLLTYVCVGCCADDASWLRGRVHAHLLRVVHPRITVQTCEAYGIRRISQVRII
jgi:hypothetical protein